MKHKKTKTYLIGDPVKRGKIRFVLRVIGMSIVLGFACIGFGAVLISWVQILRYWLEGWPFTLVGMAVLFGIMYGFAALMRALGA